MYSNAYAVTLPSDLEGMSLSLLEALSYGNAVVCSDIAENSSVAMDKAIYFKKSDVDDLAQKLQMICDDKEYTHNFKCGVAEFILNKFNWEDVADSTLNLYRKENK